MSVWLSVKLGYSSIIQVTPVNSNREKGKRYSKLGSAEKTPARLLCLVSRKRKLVRILKNQISNPHDTLLPGALPSPLLWNFATQDQRKTAHFSELMFRVIQRLCHFFTAFPYSPSAYELSFADSICFYANIHEVFSALCKKRCRKQAVNISKCHTQDTALCSQNAQSFVPQKEAEDALLHFMLFPTLSLRFILQITDSNFLLTAIQQ